MTTVIRTHRIHQPPSILLQPSLASNSPTPPSSASSASSHSSSATPRQNNIRNSFSTSSRRIRFAPLPDPRRAVLITDDGDELPLPEAEDATQFPGPSTPTPAFVSPAASAPTIPAAEAAAFYDYAGQDTESIGSSSSSSRNSKRNSYSTDPSSVPSTPGTATPLSLTTADQDYLSSVPASPSTFLPPSFLSNNYSTGTVTKPKSKVLSSLLRPFKKGSNSSSSGSSHTLTPVASLEGRSHEKHTKGGITKEEILTLGTINLFRASSRESRYAAGNESDPGFSLTRWTSASSTGARSTTSGNGAPLARTQSTQSYTSRRPSTAPGFVPPSPSRSKGNQNLNPRMRGARMLNGRVYGAPKRNTNLFANARDEEPEFVEWGYGGMGSVKGARSAGVSGGKWERLQGAGAAAAKSAEADAEDDGSGMGWVKKRKMEREREKKEREEREKEEEEERKKAEEKVEVEEKVEDVPEVTVEPTPEPEHPTLPNIANLRTLSSTSQSQRPTTPSSTHTAEEEHVLRAVTIPARPHYHHHHHRSHSRGSSKDLNISSSNLSLVHNASAEEVTVLGEVEEREEVEGRRESESSDDEEEKEEEEEEEEEDDNEEIERKRRTAVGAGVEKISRHKEVHDELSPATTPAAEI